MPEWTALCRRTEDPKLAYIEGLLDARGIPHRRNGESLHAPILEVPDTPAAWGAAWDLLDMALDVADDGKLIKLDDVPDDHPFFSNPYVRV